MRLRILNFFCLFTLCFAIFAVGKADANSITNIRWSVQSNAADGSRVIRIVADVESAVKTSAKYNEKAKTLVIDVKGAQPGKNTGNLPIKSEKIKRVASKKLSTGDTQMTIYLSGALEKDAYKVFTLLKDPANKKPDRVVIDIFEVMPKASYKITPSLKDKIIVIDAGHGGSDPGAVGLNGTKEKDATLAISLKLRDMLTKKGAKVVMTRIKDVDVHSKNATAKDELQARVDVGVKANADVFVSIHHNASVKREVGGLSTYYYAKTKYDSLLATAIQKSMLDNFALEDKGIRQADFYVTKRSPMPAALLEIAFISNPKEEKLLKSNWFQDKMATCIVQGLEKYFAQAAGSGGK